MIQEAIAAIKASTPDSAVYVGCDSVKYKKNGIWYARYATVIIIHHSTRHGASLFFTTDILPDYGNLKQRLLTEVMFATNAALEIIDHLEGRPLAVHLDINSDPQHKSNVAVKEAIGYVMGNLGFAPLLKPDSWASAHAADHCARGKQKT